MDLTIQDISCFGYDNGIVSATYSADVMLEWDVDDTTSFTAGLHVLTATNSIGCVQEYSFFVSEPEELICEVSTTPWIYPASSGVAEVSVTDGTPDYSYYWSGTFRING
ncbi:MAG: hypothetical protein IPP69_11945 [Flavobacteriales bacterium]|nr:hypothetical protein [Flavobacteriales bacterium]